MDKVIRQIEALKDYDSRVRTKAIEALGKYKDERAVEPLINALNDSVVGLDAIEALSKIGGKIAVEPLIKALKDKDSSVRRGAVIALSRYRDERAVEPLIKTLKDKSDYVTRPAAKGLGEIGDKRAVEPLIKALKDSDVREDAIEALCKIGDKRAVDPLLKYYSRQLISFRDDKEKEKFESITKPLFKKYNEIISNCFSYQENSSGTSIYQTYYSYRNDFAAISVIKLTKICTRISDNILNLIAQIEDRKVQTLANYYDEYYAEYKLLSFENIRKIATEELYQRGNPTYDPSIYLNEKEWKL